MSQDNDHDLLIRLSAGFESFEKSTHRTLFEINKGIERMGVQMEQKADKSDIRLLQDNITGIDKRVTIVEGSLRDLAVRKQTVYQLGDMGVKGWTLFVGFIAIVLSLINAIFK